MVYTAKDAVVLSQSAGFQSSGYKRDDFGFTLTPRLFFDVFPAIFTPSQIKIWDFLWWCRCISIAYVSYNDICSWCGIKSDKTITTALTKFEQLGLLKVENNAKLQGGRKLKNGYTINLDIQFIKHLINDHPKLATKGLSLPKFKKLPIFEVPDELFTLCLRELSNSEYLVVRYVCRHTYGYNKQSDKISRSQMSSGIVKKDGNQLDLGCGITKPSSVLAGVDGAIKAGYLLKKRTKNADGGDGPSNYTLNIEQDNYDVESLIAALKTGTKLPTVKREYPYRKRGTPPSRKAEDQDKARQQRIEITGAKERTENPTVKKEYPYRKKGTHKKTIKQYKKQQHTKNNVAAILQKQGFSGWAVKNLANGKTVAYIQEKIDYKDFLLAKDPSKIKNPLGWLRSAIEKDYDKPDGFIPSSERLKQAQNARKKQEQVNLAIEENERLEALSEHQKLMEQNAVVGDYRKQYGTTQGDLSTWTMFQKGIAETELGQRIKRLQIEGLQFDKETGVIKLGVLNPVIWEMVGQSRFRSGLEQSLGKWIGVSEIELDIVLMKESR